MILIVIILLMGQITVNLLMLRILEKLLNGSLSRNLYFFLRVFIKVKKNNKKNVLVNYLTQTN